MNEVTKDLDSLKLVQPNKSTHCPEYMYYDWGIGKLNRISDLRTNMVPYHRLPRTSALISLKRPLAVPTLMSVFCLIVLL